MKLAVVGSRSIEKYNLVDKIVCNVSEIITGGACGIDEVAKKYAVDNNIPLVEFLPEYNKYRRNAPLIRNSRIVDYADKVLIIWDGKSKGTQYVINKCIEKCKEYDLVII
ncbi:MAG: hypothetical protein R3Y45_02625 [Bacillota bacterium]